MSGESRPSRSLRGPIAWMARNSIAANLLMFILLGGGIWSAAAIQKEVFPQFELDIIEVNVDYPGAAPEEVEQGILRPIEGAVRGVGVEWIREIDDTYDVPKMCAVIREALTTDYDGPKVIIAASECMLNRQRREEPLRQAAISEGRRVAAPRFGVDQDICTGDHACMRLSGCPSLSLKTLPFSPNTHLLQSGHSALRSVSHGSMHSVWKAWRHRGRRL